MSQLENKSGILVLHGYWVEKDGDIGDLSRALGHSAFELYQQFPNQIQTIYAPTGDCNHVGIGTGEGIVDHILKIDPKMASVVLAASKEEGARDTFGELTLASNLAQLLNPELITLMAMRAHLPRIGMVAPRVFQGKGIYFAKLVAVEDVLLETGKDCCLEALDAARRSPQLLALEAQEPILRAITGFPGGLEALNFVSSKSKLKGNLQLGLMRNLGKLFVSD